jgi:hypothetical protein
LRYKFMIDAKSQNLMTSCRRFMSQDLGPGHSFALIATYSGLRSPKNELRMWTNWSSIPSRPTPRQLFCTP